MSIHFVITMAGFGNRFREAGYTQPKYEIVVKSRSLFWWALLSLRSWFAEGRFLFVVRRADNAADFIRAECESLGIHQFELISLDSPTDGQATTALLACDRCEADVPLAIYNIDTHMVPGAFELPRSSEQTAGFIPAFRAHGSHWSFVALDANGVVQQIAEKERISEFATAGLYWFRSATTYRESYRATYSSGNVKGSPQECYVAPVYQHLLDRGLIIRSAILAPGSVWAMGTPKEVDQFARSDYDSPR